MLYIIPDGVDDIPGGIEPEFPFAPPIAPPPEGLEVGVPPRRTGPLEPPPVLSEPLAPAILESAKSPNPGALLSSILPAF